MNTLNRHLNKVIAILIIISILLSSCEEIVTPVVDDHPLWWNRFNDAVSEISSQYGYSPQSLEYLKTNPGCTLDPIQDQTIQKYSLALLEGIDLSNTDFDAAKIKFANAVSELSKFNQSLYCVNLDGYRFWDLSIARFWDETFENPIDEMDSCQSLQATWNPAILIVDGLQQTGESEIIQVFQKHKNDMTSCLNEFPVDTYGAAWLDDFSTGDLVRVTGSTAHNNLVTALVDPSLLGIGRCPMLMHSMKMQSDSPCRDGLEMSQVCGADGVIGAFIENGYYSLKVHNANPEEIMMTGPRWNRILFNMDEPSNDSLVADFWIPKFFFGTSLEDLLGKLGVCEGGMDSAESLFSSPPLRNANACIMSLVDTGITPDEKILDCFLQYDDQLPPPPIPVTEVLLPTPEECGELGALGVGIVGGLIVYGITKLSEYVISEQVKVIEGVTQDVKDNLDKAMKDLEVAVNESIELKNKEDEPLEYVPEEDEPLTYEHNEEYPVDGTSPCVTAAQQKAAQLFQCIHGDNVPDGQSGLGPLIIPSPSTGGGLPMECNEVVDIDWKSSHGPGVTDPEGPEYWMRGGPIILDVTELSGYGYTDPVPTHLVWWTLANYEKYNIVPNDPMYDLKTSLEDIISKDLTSNPTLREEFNSYLDDRRLSELLILRDTGIGATIELTGKLESIIDDSLVINGTSLDISEEVFDSSRFSVGDYVRVVITSSEGELKVESVVLDEGR